MPNITLVRHCESVGNVAFHRSFFCQDDSMFTDAFMSVSSTEWNLSEHGKKEAEELGKFLKGYHFYKCFVSDTKRTVDTALGMGYSFDDLVITNTLRERDYNGLELRPKKDWLIAMQSLDDLMYSLVWKPNGGESMLDVIQRIASFLEFAVSDDSNVLIIAHGDVIQAMRFLLLRLTALTYESFKRMHGNHVRTGQVFFYDKNEQNSYTETSFYFNGNEWCDLSLSFNV